MTDRYSVSKSDEQWREELSPEQYAVLRESSTERPGTGELLDEERDGLYRCAACGNELFKAGTKFDAGCGWPSFYQSVRPDAVELLDDDSLGMRRTEVRCAHCGGHLGHVFPDGFGTPTGDRYCMNSLALNFEPGGQANDAAPDSTTSVFADGNYESTSAVGRHE
jgi:peptide-methionine (R)-S-oxide reductase